MDSSYGGIVTNLRQRDIKKLFVFIREDRLIYLLPYGDFQ
jgi:hypothetical protein